MTAHSARRTVSAGLFDYRLDPQPGDVIVVWFSNGAASAIAWQETLRRYGNLCDVRAVNNPVIEEDDDNLRFGEAVSQWLGRPLVKHRNPEFPDASADDVWRHERAMVFPFGAPCTRALKKEARQDYERRHRVDWHVLGFTAEEKARHKQFTVTERANVLPILIEAGLTKQDCHDRLVAAGIDPPRVYALGYPNANCIGCVKAQSATYWNLVRATYPNVFEARARLSRELGVRLVKFKGKRLFLDDLPADAKGHPLKTMKSECGVFCEERRP